MRSLHDFLYDLKDCKKIALFTHLAPDADALSSVVSIKKLIKANTDDEDKIIDIFFDAQEIGEANNILIKGIVNNLQRCHDYDLGVALDCSNLARLGKYSKLFLSCAKQANLDHHITNELFAQNNLVMKTSSTCEGIYLIAKAKNLKIPDDVCSLIYAGIITDTNNLTQGNITTNTHKVIADIIDRGINVDLINQHFFQNNSKSKTFLLKKALNSLKFFSFDRIAFMKISNKDMEDCGANFDDTLGIVNYGISLKGVSIAILAIKTDEDTYYISIRGKNGIDVATIAKNMGGGGHENCAAFTYKGTLADIHSNLMKYCNEQLDDVVVESGQSINSLFLGDEDKEYLIKPQKPTEG